MSGFCRLFAWKAFLKNISILLKEGKNNQNLYISLMISNEIPTLLFVLMLSLLYVSFLNSQSCLASLYPEKHTWLWNEFLHCSVNRLWHFSFLLNCLFFFAWSCHANIYIHRLNQLDASLLAFVSYEPMAMILIRSLAGQSFRCDNFGRDISVPWSSG